MVRAGARVRQGARVLVTHKRHTSVSAGQAHVPHHGLQSARACLTHTYSLPFSAATTTPLAGSALLCAAELLTW